jgi:hypothetical protein
MVRLQLDTLFSSKQRLKRMSYEEKRELLHSLFDGKGRDKPNGIYITRWGKDEFEYEMIGQFLYNSGIIKADDPEYWKIMQAGEGKEYYDRISAENRREKGKVLDYKTYFKSNYL